MDFEPMGKVLIGALGLVALVSPVGAQEAQKCGPHDEVAAMLRMEHKEELVGYGLSNKGSLTEFFASPEGTWTVLVTPPIGPSCMVAEGDFWKMDDALPVAGRRGV
jgi:hypothetical protein